MVQSEQNGRFGTPRAILSAKTQWVKEKPARLLNLPNVRETSLDDGFIEALILETAPILLPSGSPQDCRHFAGDR
jgi:hypothetical protein